MTADSVSVDFISTARPKGPYPGLRPFENQQRERQHGGVQMKMLVRVDVVERQPGGAKRAFEHGGRR